MASLGNWQLQKTFALGQHSLIWWLCLVLVEPWVTVPPITLSRDTCDLQLAIMPQTSRQPGTLERAYDPRQTSQNLPLGWRFYVYKIHTHPVIGNGSKILFPLGTVKWNDVSLEPFVSALLSSVEEIYLQEEVMQPLQTGNNSPVDIWFTPV